MSTCKLKYINWKEVAKIPDEGGGWYFKMALCHCRSTGVIGTGLRNAFPQYFCEKDDKTLPISWSRLVSEGRRNVSPQEGRFRDELDTRGILDSYGIPTTRFSGTQENHEEFGFPLLPREVAAQCTFGNVVEFQGIFYVVTECNYADGVIPIEIALSPQLCFKMK